MARFEERAQRARDKIARRHDAEDEYDDDNADDDDDDDHANRHHL